MGDTSKYPIGVFDSGIGGLTVLREIERILPGENIVYFGDTARVPYGGKSKATIVRFSTESILFLLKKKVKLVVIACNTSSSLALDYLKRVFSVPVLGVIEAGVEKALLRSKKKKIGVMGTSSTISSLAYQQGLTKRDKSVSVYAKACPLFVPLVEEGLLRNSITQDTIKMYLHDAKGKIDTLILGCTHYPLLKKAIGNYLKRVSLVDSAKEVALKTRDTLRESKLVNNSYKEPFRHFYVTDEPIGFKNKASVFLKHDIIVPKVVNL